MNRFLSVRCAGAVLFCSIAMSAQDAAPAKTLVVNGHASPGAVVQMNGKSYVDVEAFAQAVDATVRFEANKVILTMAAAPAAQRKRKSRLACRGNFRKRESRRSPICGSGGEELPRRCGLAWRRETGWARGCRITRLKRRRAWTKHRSRPRRTQTTKPPNS